MRPDISLWQPVPSELTINHDDAHLWMFPLTASPQVVAQCRALLNQQELNRADRLVDKNKAGYFMVARAGLRIILSRYLDLEEDQIIFKYNDHGKPCLDIAHRRDLCFNLAHSSGRAVLAVARGAEVGVDIERIDSALDYQSISGRYFSEAEKLSLRRAHPHKRRRVFYRLWTRKEAILKQQGSGFKKTPDQSSEEQLMCRSFPLASGFICTLACRPGIKMIRRFRVPDVHCLVLSDHHPRR